MRPIEDCASASSTASFAPPIRRSGTRGSVEPAAAALTSCGSTCRGGTLHRGVRTRRGIRATLRTTGRRRTPLSATLRRAAEKDPAQAEIHEHLGDALYKSGRRFEARFAWSAALLTAEANIAARVTAKLANGMSEANAAP